MRVSKRKTAAPVEDGPKVYTIPTKAEYRKMKPGFCDMEGEKWEDVYGRARCDRCKELLKPGDQYVSSGSVRHHGEWTSKYTHFPEGSCEPPVKATKRTKKAAPEKVGPVHAGDTAIYLGEKSKPKVSVLRTNNKQNKAAVLFDGKKQSIIVGLDQLEKVN